MALCGGGQWEVAFTEVQGLFEGGIQEKSEESALSKLREPRERLPLRRPALQSGQGSTAGTQTVWPEQ